MTTKTVGVRTTRGARIEFVMSSNFDPALGDVVLVESNPARYLAVVVLTTDQILATSERVYRGVIVAGPTSPEVGAALRERDAAALERAQVVLGPTVHIVGAKWSADGGRLTLDIAADQSERAALTAKLEPVFRAEVRCLGPPGPVTSA